MKVENCNNYYNVNQINNDKKSLLIKTDLNDLGTKNKSKVDLIKEKIENGTYNINLDLLANKITENLI